MEFSVEMICLTDGIGKPVPAATRPVLVEHATFPSLDQAVREVVARGGWEMIGSPTMVDGHSAVLTVRRDKAVCTIHVMPERRSNPR